MTQFQLVKAGIEVAIELAKKAHHSFNERRLDEFFRAVAVHLGAGDSEAARNLLEECLEHEWAIDGVSRGIRTMMDAACAEARTCIAALVAEYLHKSKAPDRRYRRVAAFLADAAYEDLVAAREVLDFVKAASATAESRSGKVVVGMSKKEPLHAQVYTLVPAEESLDDRRVDPHVYQGSAHLPDVLHMLTRHGFARTDVDTSYSVDLFGDGERVWVEDRIVFDRGEPLESVGLLALCLAVLPVSHGMPQEQV